MGVFEWIRAKFRDSLFDELERTYALKPGPIPGTGLSKDSEPRGLIGRHGFEALMFARFGKQLALYLGEIAEETEIHLGRMAAGEARDEPDHLARICGSEGAALAKAFELSSYPSEPDFDYPELRVPAMREALLALSPTVWSICLYPAGALLWFDGTAATAPQIDADLEQAKQLLAVMKQR